MAEWVWGLTGPTGAGKGEVCRLLTAYGFVAIDTDRLAREATAPGSPCLAELTRAFSPSILTPNGALDRAALASVAFADERAHQTLNSIVHPYVIERTAGILKAPGRFVIDAPLLFESGMNRLCSRTLAVLADRALRLARIRQRDSLDEKSATLRMSAQPDDAFYLARADRVLYNDGDLATLTDRVRVLCEREGIA